ncbi:MAG: hypothetical protein M1536_08430 [Firmicutes bacterium]|nr:hypothetical protein [Bacillota bacterium]
MNINIKNIVIPVLILLFSLAAFSEEIPQKIAKSFFEAINKKEYRKAYDYLSLAAKDDVRYPDFAEKGRDVIRVDLVSIKIIDEDSKLIRTKVKANVVGRQDNQIFKALYGGKVDLKKENGTWKIITVDLEPLAQKAVNGKERKRILQIGTGR